ncbi:MAG: response regulator transcription factor [Pseudomonadota bacterium]
MTPWSSALPAARISIAVAHKDPLVHAGLAASLASVQDFEVRTPTGDPMPAPWERPAIDVLVADYETALACFGTDRPTPDRPQAGRPKVMVISHRDTESEIRHALNLGVHGYLLLGCAIDEMIEGVRALHRGQRHLDPHAAQRVVEGLNRKELTSREGDVLRLIAVGHVNKTIATELDISVGTVKAHVKAILAKFGARTRTEAASIAQRRGLLGSGI